MTKIVTKVVAILVVRADSRKKRGHDRINVIKSGSMPMFKVSR